MDTVVYHVHHRRSFGSALPPYLAGSLDRVGPFAHCEQPFRAALRRMTFHAVGIPSHWFSGGAFSSTTMGTVADLPLPV